MPRPVLPPPPAVAALRSALPGGAVPTALRLLPAGTFRAEDGSGRPTDAPGWELTAGDADRLIGEQARRKTLGYIDYEHATLHAKQTGAQAPAAGWFSALEWRPDGLWATGIDWTAPAAQMIAQREYRYISPLFSYQPGTGRVLRLLGASLTNDPGLDGLTDLAALAAHLLNPTPETPPVTDLITQMLLCLGLPPNPDATAALSSALAAVQASQQKLAALSAQVALPPDPAQYAPVAALVALQAERSQLQSQLAALTAQARAAELATVIDAAKAAGKLPPALETWATDLGTRDLAALTAYLAAMPAIFPAGGTQSGGHPPAGGSGVAALSADERKVCALMAVKPEDYLATKTAAA